MSPFSEDNGQPLHLVDTTHFTGAWVVPADPAMRLLPEEDDDVWAFMSLSLSTGNLFVQSFPFDITDRSGRPLSIRVQGVAVDWSLDLGGDLNRCVYFTSFCSDLFFVLFTLLALLCTAPPFHSDGAGTQSYFFASPRVMMLGKTRFGARWMPWRLSCALSFDTSGSLPPLLWIPCPKLSHSAKGYTNPMASRSIDLHSIF